MKAVVAAFNQEKALVGAFSVITNLRMELFEALPHTPLSQPNAGYSADTNMCDPWQTQIFLSAVMDGGAGGVLLQYLQYLLLIYIQGVPKHWTHFVFFIFSGSRAHTEELFIAIG